MIVLSNACVFVQISFAIDVLVNEKERIYAERNCLGRNPWPYLKQILGVYNPYFTLLE